MVLKIYFGNKPVFLCDEITPAIEIYRHHPDTVFIDEMTSHAINALLHEIAKPGFHAGILFTTGIERSKKLLWKHFTVIRAAGGVIENEKNELLMIFRRGKWDLPKGKLDKGETLEACAVREVQEETGLKNVELKNFIATTFHTYNEYGRHILKESHWYRMKATSSQALKPQTEEDIHQIEWVKSDALSEKLKNTFPSVKDVIESVYRKSEK
ncbi:NUDIX domain-containing protein [Agriterribacter sp.]|uniref:NUDIX hydrolase n=1 Tax=Agriterribacter sp. TaxID=2821509 RepID=UPI002C5A6CFF|nr:NUDIX domain-containing protein [Agriterribacter sp.]HRP56260.1 NUDIX domain-containing protein [Agriterribacter sp.]